MERKQSQERKNILKRLKERKKKDKEASRKKRKLDDSDEREDEPDVIEDKKQEESKEAKEEEDAAPPSPRTPAIKPGPKKKKKAPSKARNNKTGLILKMHKAVREAEARASQGQPLPSPDSLPTDPIYYRWSRYNVLVYLLKFRSSPSSLGRANYIEPQWEWLSNMSPFPITLDGVTYPTVEHFFHIQKWVSVARVFPLLT